MLKIIYRQDDKQAFENYWRQYLDSHQASPYYLLTMLDYFLAYSSNLITDQSFAVIKGDNKPVALVFLPIEEISGVRSISIGQSYAMAPIFEDQKKLDYEIMTLISEIAAKEKVEKIMFRVDPLLHKQYSYNFLMNHDFLDTSLLGYLVDCENPSLRRNHERAIRKLRANSEFQTFIMDEKNKDYRIHEQYRQLHHKAAGKVTRAKETFDLQYRMLEEGNAILAGLKKADLFIAFTYFMFYKDMAISFSAADDPEFDHLPLYHIINHEAFLYLKNRGVKHMDMGQPLTVSRQMFHYPDQKQKNIALFKTGFGGKFVQDFRGVKYLSKEIFRKDLKNFIKQYEESIT